MNEEILISAARLNEALVSEDILLVDCRFDLANPSRGRELWSQNHLPGAFYAHLDDDLSSPVGPQTGRHPLPDQSRFAQFLSSIGWSQTSQLVAYDDGSGAIAVRLWWLMRYFGLEASLLDGGLAAWVAAGLPLEDVVPEFKHTALPVLAVRRQMVIEVQELQDRLAAVSVLDARAAERFTGEVEPLDTRAGHIPGALNRPFTDNLDAEGRFKPAHELRAEFSAVLAGREGLPVAHSCGSGVTACHNHFAMALAGLEPGRVYAGSWSEWIRDPGRPIATGN